MAAASARRGSAKVKSEIPTVAAAVSAAASASITADDENDPVVQELDVYISTGLGDDVYLYQYPLRHASKPLVDDNQEIRAKFKSMAAAEAASAADALVPAVELEVDLNINSTHFDYDRATRLAADSNETHRKAYASSAAARRSAAGAAGEASSREEKPFAQDIMNYYRLRSAPPEDASNYAVGMLEDGKLYLNAVQNVLQLRPSFFHKESKLPTDTGDEITTTVKREPSDNPQAPVEVDYKKKETSRAVSARERSFQSIRARFDEVPWVHYDWERDPARQAAVRRNLLSTAEDAIEFPFQGLAYLGALHPQQHVAVKPAHSSRRGGQREVQSTQPKTIDELQRLDLPDGLDALLMQAVAIPFADICQIFPRPSPEELFKLLHSRAHLIHGCWVARSEHVHKKHSKSFFTRASGERLATARNYLLWRLHHNSPVHMAELMEFGGIAEEDARPMLEALAVKERIVGWHFKLKADEAFMAEYPKVVATAANHFKSQVEEPVTKGLDEDHIETVRAGKPLREHEEEPEG